MKFFKSNIKLVFYINNKKLMDFLFFFFVLFSFLSLFIHFTSFIKLSL